MISIFDSHFFPQVDAPRDPTLSVGEMLKRLQEHVLSPVGEVVLAAEATETREPWRFDRGFGKSDASKKVITAIKHTKNNIVIRCYQYETIKDQWYMIISWLRIYWFYKLFMVVDSLIYYIYDCYDDDNDDDDDDDDDDYNIWICHNLG